jgi:hypothetical protein
MILESELAGVQKQVNVLKACLKKEKEAGSRMHDLEQTIRQLRLQEQTESCDAGSPKAGSYRHATLRHAEQEMRKLQSKLDRRRSSRMIREEVDEDGPAAGRGAAPVGRPPNHPGADPFCQGTPCCVRATIPTLARGP